MAHKGSRVPHPLDPSLGALQVSAALRSAAGKALGDVDDEQSARRFDGAVDPLGNEARSPERSSKRSVSELEERQGRRLTGEGSRPTRASFPLHAQPLLITVYFEVVVQLQFSRRTR